MTDAQLKKAILAAGVVSWFLGKKVLTEGDEPAQPSKLPLFLLALALVASGAER